jgi:hypothetical protein
MQIILESRIATELSERLLTGLLGSSGRILPVKLSAMVARRRGQGKLRVRRTHLTRAGEFTAPAAAKI